MTRRVAGGKPWHIKAKSVDEGRGESDKVKNNSTMANQQPKYFDAMTNLKP